MMKVKVLVLKPDGTSFVEEREVPGAWLAEEGK